VIICFLRLYFWAQVLLQKLHLNCGSTPHSYVTCRFIESFRVYRRPQFFGQRYINGIAMDSSAPDNNKRENDTNLI